MKRPVEPNSKQNTIKYPKYQYKSLGNAQNAIRLLRLGPAPDPDWPIRCSLFHTTLDAAPPYTALSYAWGDRSQIQLIQVDAETISVTANLKHALKRLRSESHEQELILWVDAICINQENIPERNIQTANMRAIYQNATGVAIWLGLENYGSKEAMLLAHDLNSCKTKEDVKALLMDETRLEALEALVVLFRRQYWWRIWVIQEVSSAKSAMVFCGDDTVSWSDLNNVCDILKTVEPQLQSLFYKRPSFIRTLLHGGPRGLQLSRYSPTACTPPLLELLVSHKSKKSTDPKDKVYALVGISNSSQTYGQIDYSLSVREIYTHTAKHIITTTQKLDVICVTQQNTNAFDLPSWATDYTRPPHRSGATIVGLHHHEPPFTAAGNTLANVKFLSNGYVLKAKGFVLDKIKTLGMKYRQQGAPSDVVPALEAFHNWWKLFVETHSDSLSAQASFARTITCGNWDFQNDALYAAKLEAIFALSDEMMSESDILRSDPPPPPPSRASTMSSSFSLNDEDEYFGDENEEKTRYSALLSATLTMNRRRFILSSSGMVGLAPGYAEDGDVICILLGCRFPIVLRMIEGRSYLIGEAYVDGYMHGEAMTGLKGGKYELASFEIH